MHKFVPPPCCRSRMLDSSVPHTYIIASTLAKAIHGFRFRQHRLGMRLLHVQTLFGVLS